LQVNLGDAYLNLGQDDKALTAFDRAVDISASPVVWNNIAYQLSLKKAHLDKAQQYAESAVAATAAELRNLTLEQLNVRDLGLVPSLVAYWDTLGWVLFTRGDFDKAEKYVAAAWLLGQHGEVGDHLGQIYEKQGKKEEAVHTYAMALNGFRPTPETKEHLQKAAGTGNSKVTEKYKDELRQLGTFRIPNPKKVSGNADFFLLLTPEKGKTKVENLKFVSGTENLRDFVGALRTIDYKASFPDDSPTKILRRGTLTCKSADGNCLFVFVPPDDVHAVD